MFPRERLINSGASSLSDYELLAIILRTGRKGEDVLTLSRKIINKFNGWRGLEKAGIRELATTEGIGIAKAVTIKAVFEICRRLSMESVRKRRITSPEDAFSFIKPLIWNEEREKLMVVMLDNKNQVIKYEIPGIGSGNGIVLTPREIFISAVKESASGIILGHNHPSGDPTPSKADIEFTKRVKEAGEILGIRLLDHIIVGNNSFRSMKNMGII